MRKAIIRGIVLTSLLSLFLVLLIFNQFDFLDWRLLWLETFGGFPLIVSIVMATLMVGVLIGLLSYQLQRKELQFIKTALEQVGSGRSEEKVLYYGQIKDTAQIVHLINGVQQQLHQVTKRMQEVMSEQLEDQEEQIEARLTEERNRLARELHDSVSQELFAASMLVSAINEIATDESQQLMQVLGQIEQMIQQAQLEMRALLLHLRPIALKNHSLKEGIDQLLSELIEKIPISINWHLEDLHLNRAVEDHLFRILQESLSNALRHSKANQLDVLFIAREGIAILSVVDDGVGFDSEKEQSGSYGLTNMQERTMEIGGQFRIVSLPGQGTKVTVRVPINSEG
ncbi:sensor histidine kinase [Amphibacillus sp. MSJ-3]|uniref:sensor histidine kinase n=1 Tax=Amphibacillus sp. MSJ-3 TaxID=2841505 RepID=UPI001C0E9808|nr:sensor histidine kinase [Amphibacillus sp. MSJ-3]MBU5593916.1 sensor histidine kinase [Amphibacillus sp. MSJ-3]